MTRTPRIEAHVGPKRAFRFPTAQFKVGLKVRVAASAPRRTRVCGCQIKLLGRGYETLPFRSDDIPVGARALRRSTLTHWGDGKDQRLP